MKMRDISNICRAKHLPNFLFVWILLQTFRLFACSASASTSSSRSTAFGQEVTRPSSAVQRQALWVGPDVGRVEWGFPWDPPYGGVGIPELHGAHSFRILFRRQTGSGSPTWCVLVRPTVISHDLKTSYGWSIMPVAQQRMREDEENNRYRVRPSPNKGLT